MQGAAGLESNKGAKKQANKGPALLTWPGLTCLVRKIASYMEKKRPNEWKNIDILVHHWLVE